MTRTKRSFWNLASGVLASGSMMLTALIATPFLLRWLGDERLGAFRAASDWAGYLTLLELGLGGALQALLARALGRQDRQEVARVLAVGIRSYLGLTGLMLAAGAGLALALPSLVRLEPPLERDLQTGFFLGLAALLWLPLAPFRALAEAGQRGYLVNGLILAQSLVTAGSALALAWSGWGITGQFLALVLGGIPFYVVLVGDGLRRCPQVLAALRPGANHASYRSALWSLNWPTLVNNLCGRVGLMTDNIIISLVLGPVLVVPFFVSQRLVALAGSQVGMLGNATWAALAELHARGERERLNQRLAELTRLTAVLGLAVLVPTALFTRSFVSLWVGAERYGGDAVVFIAAANAFLLPLLSLWGWVFSGTGKAGRIAPLLIVQTAVNLAVSILGTYWLGLIGPLLGTLVATVGVGLWWLPVMLRQDFGTPARALFRAAAGPLLVATPFAIALYVVTRSYQPQGWVSLACHLGGMCLLYLAAAWWLLLNPADRLAWRHRWRLAWQAGGAAT